MLEKFSEYCNPRKNITILHHNFFTYQIHEEQNFHNFVTELKKFSSKCEFETLHDTLIKYVIVCGANDNILRGSLPRESVLTLNKGISAGNAAEKTCEHVHKILKSNEAIELHRISKHSKFRSQTSTQTTDITKKCKFCENSRHRGKCLVHGNICHNCNRKNHFEKCSRRSRKTLYETESPSPDHYDFFLNTIILQRNLEKFG